MLELLELARFMTTSPVGEPPPSPPLHQWLSQALFSGQTSAYSDAAQGFKVDIPIEFNQTMQGINTHWHGPMTDGIATTITVNAAPLPGVPADVVYNANLNAKKNDPAYTEIVPMRVKFGNSTAPALRFKEVNTDRATGTQKADEEIHRWHLLVFGNEKLYTWGFTGSFKAFEDNILPPVFEQAINSVNLM